MATITVKLKRQNTFGKCNINVVFFQIEFIKDTYLRWSMLGISFVKSRIDTAIILLLLDYLALHLLKTLIVNVTFCMVIDILYTSL